MDFFFFLFFWCFFLVNGQARISSIFILSGQSNMAGRGGVTNRTWNRHVPLECRPNRAIYRLSPALRWEPAREPIHEGIDGDTCGIGPGMAFADDIVRYTGTRLGTVGLVPCAVGGSKITDWARGSWLYERMVQRARNARQGGGKIRALLWYQGESDTVDFRDAHAYGTRIGQFVKNVRQDLKSPNLPIIQVAIATRMGPYINEVRRGQFGLRLPNVVTVDAKGLHVGKDFVHLTTRGEVQLGHMLANAYLTHFSHLMIA